MICPEPINPERVELPVSGIHRKTAAWQGGGHEIVRGAASPFMARGFSFIGINDVPLARTSKSPPIALEGSTLRS